MAKLTNTELKALAEQLTQKLNAAASKTYAAISAAFEAKNKGILETFKKDVERMAKNRNIEVSFNSWGYGMKYAPEQPEHFYTEDILNRLIIKQIDIKDVTALMKAVEKDLKS